MTDAPVTAPDQVGDLGLLDPATIGTGDCRSRSAGAARLGAAGASATVVDLRQEPLVDIPIHQTLADDLEARYGWLAAQVPLDQRGVACDVARWTTFLLSSRSSVVTGAVVALDGGRVARRA
jgi:hypothetical protein